MLRYLGLGLGAVLLAAELLGANPAAARPRSRNHSVRSNGHWVRRPYVQNPPYGNAYGYRARQADRDRDGIPDYLERNNGRTYRSRVAGYRSTYRRDYDRDGVPDYRDRHPRNRFRR